MKLSDAFVHVALGKKEAGEPTEEEEMADMRIMYLLMQCASAQNALEVAKD